MLGRVAIISLSALATIAAAPEPVKPAAPAQPANRPVAILASADHVHATTQPADAPQKPRAVRVTSCRCAGQLPEPAEDPKDP